MARYQTSEEAVVALSKDLTAKTTRLNQLRSSSDAVLQKEAEKVAKEVKVLERKISIEAMSMEGMFGKTKVAGVGLLTGLPKGFTSIIDMITTGAKKVDDMLPNVPGGFKMREDFLLTPKIAPGYESSSRESAPAFGFGEGAGMSAIGGPTQMAIGGVTRSIDEAVFEGTPITQLTTAAFLLSKAGYNTAKNWQENRGARKMLEQLGPDGANQLRRFMLLGQDSTDPLVAGAVAKLRKNPEYADLFTSLEKEMSKVAMKGSRVDVKKGYPTEASGQGIYQAVEGRIKQLQENIKLLPQSKFTAAKQMGGNNNILSTDSTLKNIDNMIADYSLLGTDDARSAVKFLERFKNRMTTTVAEGTQGAASPVTTQMVQTQAGLTTAPADLAGVGASAASTTTKISAEKMQALLSEFGSQAKQGESLITNVSLGTQQKIATEIFSGLKDDLLFTGKNSTVPRIKDVSKILEAARAQVKKGYDEYSAFIAQGLPAKLKNVNINAVDTEELLRTVKSLSNAQRDSLAVVLKDTAPEDLKRVRQVLYDDFTQSAKAILPDGNTGVDVKLLSTKFNTLDENDRKAMAFSLGANFEDFTGRMKDVENFYKYQQKFGGVAAGKGLTATELSELSSAGWLAGGYGTGKTAGLVGRLYNSIKGGLSDQNLMTLLTSPDTRGVLRESLTNPNSVNTLNKIDRVLGGAQAAQPAVEAASYTARSLMPTEQAIRPDLNLEVAQPMPEQSGSVTVQGAPLDMQAEPQTMPQEQAPQQVRPDLDLSMMDEEQNMA